MEEIGNKSATRFHQLSRWLSLFKDTLENELKGFLGRVQLATKNCMGGEPFTFTGRSLMIRPGKKSFQVVRPTTCLHSFLCKCQSPKFLQHGLGHNFDSSPSLPALNPTFVAAKPRPKVRRLKEHLAAELGVSRFRLQLFDDNGPVEETAVIDSRHQDWSCLVSLKQFWSIFGVEGGSGIQKLRFGFITFNAFCLLNFSSFFSHGSAHRKLGEGSSTADLGLLPQRRFAAHPCRAAEPLEKARGLATYAAGSRCHRVLPAKK